MSEEKQKKPFYKKWWVWVIVVIAIAAIASGGGDEEVATDEEAIVEETEATEKEANNEEEAIEEESAEEALEEKVFKVGEPVEHDDYVLTVNNVEFSSGNDFDKPSSGNEYVIVEVTIENNGEDTISYNPFNFKIQNSNRNITDQAFTTIDNDTALSSGELAPGGHVTGTITFEAPIDDPELTLIFEPSFWSADQVRISLN